MQITAVGFIVAAALAVGISQKPEDGAMPPAKKGDTLVIRGCVSGSLLKDLRGQKMDPVSGGETAVVYRLSGEKKLLQIIQKEHQDQVLDVTGVLASNPNVSSTTRSKRLASTSALAARTRRCRHNHPRIQPFASHHSKSFGRAAPSQCSMSNGQTLSIEH